MFSYGQEKVETSEQKQKLGTRAQTPDGRVFYYARNGSAAISTAGMIVDAAAAFAIAAHDMDVPANANDAGTTALSVEGPTTDLTLNQYADGYLIFNDGPGQGEVYRVASNSAVAGATGLTVTIADPGGFRTALTTASLFGLAYNPYTDVKVIDGDGPMTTGALGVTTIPVTASYYCWIQTAGIASVLSGAVVAIVGDAVGVSQASGESGAFDLWDVSTNEDTFPIGVAMGIPSVDTDYQIVDLKIRF